jgi:hypothetical protein
MLLITLSTRDGCAGLREKLGWGTKKEKGGEVFLPA